MIWTGDENCGVIVTVRSRKELCDDIAGRLRARLGFALATLNLDHVVKLGRDSAFAAAYQAQTHVTADGNPIVWLSRLAGQHVELVPGSELIGPVAQIAVNSGAPVGLFGSDPDTLAVTATELRRRHSGIEISFQQSPPMGFDPTSPAADAAIAAIGASGARVIFLALGAPRQEIFAARAFEALPHVGFLSIGAGLDFIAKTQVRAPRWVRFFAAEWLWRLLRNPRRLAGRYAACLRILPGFTHRALKTRWYREVE